MVRPIDLARQWHNEGLISKTSMAKLEARYADDAGPEVGHPNRVDEGFSRMAVTLLAGAAWVLTAAILAGPAIAGAEPMAFGIVGIIGAGLAGAGSFLLWRLAGADEYAEALGVTAILLFATAGFAFGSEGLEVFTFIAAAMFLALPWLPQKTGLIASHGALLSLGLWIMAFMFAEMGDAAVVVGFVLSLLLVASMLLVPRLVTARDWTPIGDASFLAAVALIVMAVWFSVDTLGLDDSYAIELFVGFIAALCIGAGYFFGSRPVLLAGVLGLSVDAVVFGFDIGVFAGIPMLLLVSGALVFLAIWSQRRGGLPVAKARRRN